MRDTIVFHGYEEMPSMPVTLGTTRGNKTGSWKYLRPVYRDVTAPCREGCPNGNDIQAVMRLLADGDLDGAWTRLVTENPFPAVTGRVCHHPCETACNRGRFDEALAIHHIERFLGDYGLTRGKRVSPLRDAQKAERVAVVGAGPAGLAAAYHLARLGYEVTVFEAEAEPGGVLRYGIPSYRLPKEVLEGEIERITALGVRIRTRTRLGREVTWDELDDDAVFVATGAGESRALNVPGEELEGVYQGLEFLKRLNTGGDVQIGERVAVIGGGNTAIDVARSAVRLGAHVQILYRRTREEMPAIPDEVEEALAEGVELHPLLAPLAIHGREGRGHELELIRMELGEPDESGRRRPVPIEGSNHRIAFDTVITAIGERPDLSFMPAELGDRANVLHVNGVGRTPIENVFAGGDIVDQPHTVVDALASGKRAAMAIDRLFQGQDLSEALEGVRVGRKGALSMRQYLAGRESDGADPGRVADFEELNLSYFESSERVPMPRRSVRDFHGDFEELAQGYAEAMALAEASRCFNCGSCTECDNCLVFCPDFAVLRNGMGTRVGQPYVVDYDYCKGCGICAYECPRGAIGLVREGSY